jgi:HEAT repeat protein
VKPDPVLVNDLKAILEPIVAARGRPDRRLVARQARRLRRLRRDGWLAALDRVVGRSVQRKRAAAELLAEMADLPEVANRFESWLRDADLGWRAEVIVLVGRRGLARFAPLLNDALDGNADDLCRAYAITAAEELRVEANLPALLRLAGDPALDPLFRRMLPALTAYADPRCRPALKRFFRPDQPREVRVFAAWGLGKLGDEEAIRYLAAMLDDPEVRTPTSYDPGESLRAAQGLCDIRGWPFAWGREGVARTRRRWLRSLKGQAGD